jgi:hypothetical protein
MALRSELFRRDARLHHCAVVDSHPILPGCRGIFVSRLQSAILILGDQPVDGGELEMAFFGSTTVRAINGWQREHLLMPRRSRGNCHSQPFDGRIDRATIQQLDSDMAAFERRALLAGIPV